MSVTIKKNGIKVYRDGESIEIDAIAGKDASVTSQNIQTALGYTPAKSSDLSEAKAAINDLTTTVNGKADKTALQSTNTDLNRLWELNRGVSYDFEQDSTAGNKTIPDGARVVKPLSVGGKCEVVDGSILTADVSAIVVKDSDSTTVSTRSIPTAVRSLTGYGWSAGSVSNEVDFERKKFVQRVGRVDLGTLSWARATSGSRPVFWQCASSTKYSPVIKNASDNQICNRYQAGTNYNPWAVNTDGAICAYSNGYIAFRDSTFDDYDAQSVKQSLNGVYLYYELATPIETDISSLLTDTNPIECEEGGSVEFVNANGLSVPNTVEYFVGKNPVQDVQINGTSITENGVANIPIASGSLGLVSSNGNYGVNARSSDGVMRVNAASEAEIGLRSQSYKPVVPSTLNYALKAALTDSNRDTTYTDAQKANACDTIGAVYDSQLELIEEITVTESGITSIARSKCTDGTSYNFRKIVAIIVLATGSSTSLNITVNGYGIITLGSVGNTSYNYYMSIISEVIGGRLFVGASGGLGGSENAHLNSRSTRGSGLYAATSIESINLKRTNWEVGTTIKLYAMR